jgi:hypothetical protein
MGKIKIKKSEDKPETKEVLADAIVRIGRGFAELHRSGLNREAIVVLLHSKTRISKSDIYTILDGLEQLEGWYCRQPAKGKK